VALREVDRLSSSFMTRSTGQHLSDRALCAEHPVDRGWADEHPDRRAPPIEFGSVQHFFWQLMRRPDVKRRAQTGGWAVA